MTNIKNVFFVNAEERKEASKLYGAESSQYLGMVASVASGSGLVIYGNTMNNYMPAWIMSGICAYLEKTRKNNKPIILQDYNFFVYVYDRFAFVEVETKAVVRVA
ncbi:MAG: hypothetical protein SPJ07_01655 [Bacilli bacterium]|nr:hypothetical protein [Bacilli bacterium]